VNPDDVIPWPSIHGVHAVLAADVARGALIAVHTRSGDRVIVSKQASAPAPVETTARPPANAAPPGVHPAGEHPLDRIMAIPREAVLYPATLRTRIIPAREAPWH
jgi:hypothetical protein